MKGVEGSSKPYLSETRPLVVPLTEASCIEIFTVLKQSPIRGYATEGNSTLGD